tara:strand:- start:44 stop:394 length:351 start_codon:yes stop_codon:yes gene_type:complete
VTSCTKANKNADGPKPFHTISLQKKTIDVSLELASLEGTLREAARDAWSAVMEANVQADILLSKLSHGAGEEALHRLDSWVDNIKDDESVLRLYRDIIKKATEDASCTHRGGCSTP